VTFDGLGGLEMVNQARKRVLRFQKWALDRILALVAFIFAIPFFVVIPLLIKLTSRGPVFYRQERLGRGGEPFRVWKFRSMYADADERLQRLIAEHPAMADEWANRFKFSDVPRVTPLGRFLRRTSLDELPSLWNVLRGEVSLVGPRSLYVKYNALYNEEQARRLEIRPGITGLAQVNGRNAITWEKRFAYDVQYVDHITFLGDWKIILKTVWKVIAREGITSETSVTMEEFKGSVAEEVSYE